MNKKELKEIYSNLSKNIELLNNFDIKTILSIIMCKHSSRVEEC